MCSLFGKEKTCFAALCEIVIFILVSCVRSCLWFFRVGIMYLFGKEKTCLLVLCGIVIFLLVW
jgi:hypothetical protein